MSKKEKIKLPDALLDIVSGGLLLYNGNPVTDINLYTDGIEIFTDKGSEVIGYSPEDQAAMDRDPVGAMKDFDENLTRLHKDNKHYEITEIFGVRQR